MILFETFPIDGRGCVGGGVILLLQPAGVGELQRRGDAVLSKLDDGKRLRIYRVTDRLATLPHPEAGE